MNKYRKPQHGTRDAAEFMFASSKKPERMYERICMLMRVYARKCMLMSMYTRICMRMRMHVCVQQEA